MVLSPLPPDPTVYYKLRVPVTIVGAKGEGEAVAKFSLLLGERVGEQRCELRRARFFLMHPSLPHDRYT